MSDLIDRRIDFDQWEYCVVRATRISFIDVLSAVPPFHSHAWKSKPAERRDRSQSRNSLLRRGFGVIEEAGNAQSSKYRGGGGVCEKFVNCYCYM
jgi:hypothetical protein